MKRSNAIATAILFTAAVLGATWDGADRIADRHEACADEIQAMQDAREAAWGKTDRVLSRSYVKALSKARQCERAFDDRN